MSLLINVFTDISVFKTNLRVKNRNEYKHKLTVTYESFEMFQFHRQSQGMSKMSFLKWPGRLNRKRLRGDKIMVILEGAAMFTKAFV